MRRGRTGSTSATCDVDTLRAMVMCCLPDVSTMQVDGQTKMAVTCDPLDLLNFIKQRFHADESDVRAGGDGRARDLRPEQGGV